MKIMTERSNTGVAGLPVNAITVVAIGGHSLAREGRLGLEAQRAALQETAMHVAGFVTAGWGIVLTHGNGPQIGLNLLRNEVAAGTVPPAPLDILGAETQGAIGYLIQQTLAEEFRRRGIAKPVVTIVTQVIVDGSDPAFAHPTKFIGPEYTKQDADRYAAERGWMLAEDPGRGWRRVVPSPTPRAIVELLAIRSLLNCGVVVIAAGGGGIPVVRCRDGSLRGVEAVVDKDRVAGVLAHEVGAQRLVISTAVEQVALGYRTPQQRFLDVLTVDEARQYLECGQFPPGSMGPKVEAAVEFLDGGGREVIITSPESLTRAMAGRAGTRIIAAVRPGMPIPAT